MSRNSRSRRFSSWDRRSDFTHSGRYVGTTRSVPRGDWLRSGGRIRNPGLKTLQLGSGDLGPYKEPDRVRFIHRTPKRVLFNRYVVLPLKKRVIRAVTPNVLPSYRQIPGVAAFRSVKKGLETTAFLAENPSRILPCAARAVRRRVLHALGIAGGSGLRGPSYTEKSKEAC